MLEDKLEEARLQSVKRRKIIAICLFAVVCLCGVIVFSLSSFDYPSNKKVQVVAIDEKKIPENEQRAVSIEEKQADITIEKNRSEYIEALQQYQTGLETRLQKVDLERWDKGAFIEINGLKEKATASFSGGDYSKALETLQRLQARTVEVLDEAERVFKANIEKAASFLAEDLYDEAKLYLEKAMTVIPQSPEAEELQKRVEKLPSILPLLHEAEVARLENDLQKEYDVLQQVQQYSPERDGITQRLVLLEQLIRSQKFETHLSAGFISIENRLLKEARYNYQQASQIDSDRPELTLLRDQLLALEKSLRVEQAINQAEQAVRRDDWLQARDNYASAAKDAPGNLTVIEGLKRAEHILSLQGRFNQYFENPYRLSNENVLSEAEKTLIQADIASDYSFGIRRQAVQLSELITKINRLVPVTVISDGKTYVSVRRIGKVGVISQKTIQLKPGNYSFEGARDGFKSKLVQVHIPYDQDDISIRIICDEPI